MGEIQISFRKASTNFKILELKAKSAKSVYSFAVHHRSVIADLLVLKNKIGFSSFQFLSHSGDEIRILDGDWACVCVG